MKAFLLLAVYVTLYVSCYNLFLKRLRSLENFSSLKLTPPAYRINWFMCSRIHVPDHIFIITLDRAQNIALSQLSIIRESAKAALMIFLSFPRIECFSTFVSVKEALNQVFLNLSLSDWKLWMRSFSAFLSVTVFLNFLFQWWIFFFLFQWWKCYLCYCMWEKLTTYSCVQLMLDKFVQC